MSREQKILKNALQQAWSHPFEAFRRCFSHLLKKLSNIPAQFPEHQAGDSTMAFPTTRWTLIRQAASAPTPQSSAALEELCRNYADVVLAFIRRRVVSRETAEDLAQEFFTRLVRGELLSRADPGKGRFRSFLLNAVRDFLNDMQDREHALKRGGTVRHFSFSSEGTNEPMTELTADQEFDVRWARSVLQRSLDRLEQEYADGRRNLFEALKNKLDGTHEESGRELARQLNMSETAVRVALHRMRQRLGQLIREEVAETVPSGSEVDDEILNLRRTLETVR